MSELVEALLAAVLTDCSSIGNRSLVEPLFDRLVENERQAQTLIQLRDTLLPRLIPGQLRLPEAEYTVEVTLA